MVMACLYSYGLYDYDLHSYGLYGYGLYDNGLYNSGLLPPVQNWSRWGPAFRCHLAGLLLKWLNPGLQWGWGMQGRSAVSDLQNYKFHSKTLGLCVELGPQKALFRGVGDLVFVPSKGKPAFGETSGYLGGRLRMHTGRGTSLVVPENLPRPAKNVKMAQKMKTALEKTKKFENSTKRCGIVFFEVRAFQRYAVCLVWTMSH